MIERSDRRGETAGRLELKRSPAFDMRTRKSIATFRHPFTLNADVGELPPGTYDVEIDEEEIQATDRTAYRRVAIHMYVPNSASTRTIIVNPGDFESALERELKSTIGKGRDGY
jgi:hypothetical protein